MREKNLQGYDVVIALGGKDYSVIVRKVFEDVSKVIALAEGLPLGKAMGHVRTLLTLEKADMLKRIAGLS